MEILLTILGGIVAVVGVLAITTILRGYVLTWLWLWFIAPVFSLPPISIVQAIGISAVVSFLTLRVETKDESEQKKKSFWSLMLDSFMSSCVVLGLSYLIHCFM